MYNKVLNEKEIRKKYKKKKYDRNLLLSCSHTFMLCSELMRKLTSHLRCLQILP
jgi:hypothetical protein